MAKKQKRVKSPKVKKEDQREAGINITTVLAIIKELVAREFSGMDERVSIATSLSLIDPADYHRSAVDVSIVVKYHDSGAYRSEERLIEFQIIIEDMDPDDPFLLLVEWADIEAKSFQELIQPHLDVEV
ncbi:MAG: hypothetical protein GY938_13110 [Ketobacter sp.]|nr:hypothetical protein [Ketobacter sp.]